MTRRVLEEQNGDETIALASYFDRLFPLLRSLTGSGVRQTLDILGELMPLQRIEIASGTRVFDWTVPKEWVVREAYLEGPDGKRIVDVRDNNLHLINYSVGFRGELSREDLEAHLFSRSDLPNAVPYVTSYYAPRWGFCMTHRMRVGLPPGQYRAVIDAEHVDGSMSLAECVLEGETDREILLAADICHPSLGNDDLSGPLALAFLYRRIVAWRRRRLTYRFVFHPETIGSIAYLASHGDHLMRHCVAGYVLTNVGAAAPFRYKRSRKNDSLADRAAERVLLERCGDAHLVRDFTPMGSDERQYCSPGFNLPVGVLSRTPDKYPEYHTSLDNRDFVSFDALAEAVDAHEAICQTLDDNLRYRNLQPLGEPQLGRRGLYDMVGRAGPPEAATQALLWVLNLSDGSQDLLTIAKRSGMPFDLIAEMATVAMKADLLAPVE